MKSPEVQLRVPCNRCEKDKWCKICNDTKYVTSWVPLEKIFTGYGTWDFKAVYVVPFSE